MIQQGEISAGVGGGGRVRLLTSAGAAAVVLAVLALYSPFSDSSAGLNLLSDSGTSLRRSTSVVGDDGDFLLPCSSLRGSPNGHWEVDFELTSTAYYDNHHPQYSPANIHHIPDPSDPTTTQHRKPTTYVWRDPPQIEERCGRVMPLTTDAFCRETKRLGLGRILFVGDSIGFQQSLAFARQLGVDVPNKGPKDGRNAAQKWDSTYNCPDDHSVELRHVRNDRLIEEVDIPPNSPRYREYFGPFAEAYLSAPPTVRTLLHVNTGAHFPGQPFKPSYVEIIDMFLTDMRVRYRRPEDIVMVRTTPAGHPTCRTATEPFGSQEEYYQSLVSPPADVKGKVDAYGWRDMVGLNGSLKDAVGRYNNDDDNNKGGGGGPDKIHIVDVVPMTNLRQDGHISSPDNLSPKKSAFDCLHYNMPGPVDWFNNLMWANLADIPSDDGGIVNVPRPPKQAPLSFDGPATVVHKK